MNIVGRSRSQQVKQAVGGHANLPFQIPFGRTSAMRSNLPVTNVEYPIGDDVLIVSKTDTKGRIVFFNDQFVKASGFSEQELLRQPHNIVRHPDMPPEAFEDLWVTLKAGKPWAGAVKNRRKNGDFYWVCLLYTSDAA